MYAIVEVGSRQYKVSEGDMIRAHSLKEEAGKDITLDKVLLFANGTDIRIGQPFLKDVKVTAKVVQHGLDAKVIAFKFRRRKGSAQKIGNRQKRTELTITKISA